MALQLNNVCRAEARVGNNAFICATPMAEPALGLPCRCLSTRRLNLGIHFGFHVMTLVERFDAEVSLRLRHALSLTNRARLAGHRATRRAALLIDE